MKLHTVFVTHDRLELTQEAIQSYLDTVSVPFTLAVVDNASSDGTQAWLKTFARKTGHQILLLPENRYPGFACNRGWELAPDDADFLHRADNDWAFLPRWCTAVENAFRRLRIGQVGLRTDREESRLNDMGIREPIRWNVGGNMVIRRKLWNMGLRYDERPWTELPTGMSEDTYLSPEIQKMGWRWTRVRHPCIVDIGLHKVGHTRDPYYLKSWGDRGIGPRARRSARRRR